LRKPSFYELDCFGLHKSPTEQKPASSQTSVLSYRDTGK